MNVLLVSQCDKQALVESRRILDQFAERRGDRVWQTPITQDGLDTLRKMLKRTARRNTAVACHWIRGRDHSELLWIVGDARRFNSQGAAPTNATESDILRRADENDWHTAEDIRLLAELGALFHDFGKASRAFQAKLRTRSRQAVADPFRHEWVSLRLFEAFVGEDPDTIWLERLAHCDEQATELCLSRLARDDRRAESSPFRKGRLPPLAQIVGWLIVTHHRLPHSPHGKHFPATGLSSLLAPLLPDWNDAHQDAPARDKSSCWEFLGGTPFSSDEWRKRAQKCASAMLARTDFVNGAGRFIKDPYVTHVARLALMLADHYYSSLPGLGHSKDIGSVLCANTNHTTGALSQLLDEHIVGVASNAKRIIRTLPRLDRELPRIARCKGFQRRSEDELFRWQDKAYDLAKSLREVAFGSGFFGVNMASTGCGKTLANGRILYGLADPQRGARFTIALGLRTLTLQTGRAYRERLGLGEDDLAVLVGGGAARELFALGERESRHSVAGCESAEDLLPDNTYVHFEGNVEQGPLKRWLTTNPDANKLLQAPILVCTIDHLVPATESLRGGRQIGPMLRLLTSDLVLDEPDDFDLGDLPALSRLVHWAGVLGSRVVLSSATLPPAMLQGLFEAYRRGRGIYRENRGDTRRPLGIACAWFDEFRAEAKTLGSFEEFRECHDAYVDKRLARLRQEEPRRAVQLIDGVVSNQNRDVVCQSIAERLPEWILSLHSQHHVEDPQTHKRVSFGLVRMANIEPLMSVASSLYQQGFPPNSRIHLCVYHANHPLVMRSAIERQLDATLRRRVPLAVFDLPSVREALDGSCEPDQVFVVLASPVAEVGRDHDYDWAVVEPSSMRSLIQLAGRVRRHRPGACKAPNILVLEQNVRGKSGEPIAFTCPGFESEEFQLKAHSLKDLLTPEQLGVLDAGPRIQERKSLEWRTNLVDLEHQQLHMLMLGEGAASVKYAVPHWWGTPAFLIGQLQYSQRFRDGSRDDTYALVPEEDDSSLQFYRCDNWVRVSNLYREAPLDIGDRIQTWGPFDYVEELDRLALQLNMDVISCGRRYGTVALRESLHGWSYNPRLGFRKQT
jgi:CRISPR-associated endonuclease/helicase Cas3